MTPIEKVILNNQLAILRCLYNVTERLDMEITAKETRTFIEKTEETIIELEKMYKL